MSDFMYCSECFWAALHNLLYCFCGLYVFVRSLSSGIPRQFLPGTSSFPYGVQCGYGGGQKCVRKSTVMNKSESLLSNDEVRWCNEIRKIGASVSLAKAGLHASFISVFKISWHTFCLAQQKIANFL